MNNYILGSLALFNYCALWSALMSCGVISYCQYVGVPSVYYGFEGISKVFSREIAFGIILFLTIIPTLVLASVLSGRLMTYRKLLFWLVLLNLVVTVGLLVVPLDNPYAPRFPEVSLR